MNEIQWKAQRPKDSSLNINKVATLLNQKTLELFKALETTQDEKSKHALNTENKIEVKTAITKPKPKTELA